MERGCGCITYRLGSINKCITFVHVNFYRLTPVVFFVVFFLSFLFLLFLLWSRSHGVLVCWCVVACVERARARTIQREFCVRARARTTTRCRDCNQLSDTVGWSPLVNRCPLERFACVVYTRIEHGEACFFFWWDRLRVCSFAMCCCSARRSQTWMINSLRRLRSEWNRKESRTRQPASRYCRLGVCYFCACFMLLRLAVLYGVGFMSLFVWRGTKHISRTFSRIKPEVFGISVLQIYLKADKCLRMEDRLKFTL